ncbi:MAG: FAD-binding oxidoreductase [Woeseia sp.]
MLDTTVLLDRLKDIVGPAGWIADPDLLAPHLTEWRGVYRGNTPLMVSPDSTRQVAEIVRACAETGTGLVPQGGNTGLCGGAIPGVAGDQVLLSLRRLNAIRAVSSEDFSLVAEAGCLLVQVQTAAANAGRIFPLSLAAEGSCQIGGNLSTDAGGINVLRYGTARNQVLGLEVVLADGSIWDGLRALRKDTAGYNLKHLFIGAEGTLGIITAATLRLYPPVANTRTAFIALAAPADSVALLAFLRHELADGIDAFELIQDRALRFVLRHIPGTRVPFDVEHPWYVLLEASHPSDPEAIENVMARALERSLVQDAVIAKNESEAAALWRLRHSISEAQKLEGASLKHDVSVPVGEVGAFIGKAELAILQYLPEARVVAFGHVGDGNVHLNVSQPRSWPGERFLEEREAIAGIVYELVATFHGSISAEHGIGQAKRGYLEDYRGLVELSLMRKIKAALDPGNILNPGKVL